MPQAICGLCNLFPKVHVDCYEKYQAGDLKGALKLQDLLADADSVGPKIGGIRMSPLVLVTVWGINLLMSQRASRRLSSTTMAMALWPCGPPSCPSARTSCRRQTSCTAS